MKHGYYRLAPHILYVTFHSYKKIKSFTKGMSVLRHDGGVVEIRLECPLRERAIPLPDNPIATCKTCVHLIRKEIGACEFTYEPITRPPVDLDRLVVELRARRIPSSQRILTYRFHLDESPHVLEENDIPFSVILFMLPALLVTGTLDWCVGITQKVSRALKRPSR